MAAAGTWDLKFLSITPVLIGLVRGLWVGDGWENGRVLVICFASVLAFVGVGRA